MRRRAPAVALPTAVLSFVYCIGRASPLRARKRLFSVSIRSERLAQFARPGTEIGQEVPGVGRGTSPASAHRVAQRERSAYHGYTFPTMAHLGRVTLRRRHTRRVAGRCADHGRPSFTGEFLHIADLTESAAGKVHFAAGTRRLIWDYNQSWLRRNSWGDGAVGSADRQVWAQAEQ